MVSSTNSEASSLVQHSEGDAAMDLNLSRIEYFLTAAEHLSFTRAAAALYITQPSLSKQVALFEDELGVRLFIRAHGDLQLTPAGKLLQHELKQLMPKLDAIVEKVKRLESEKREALYIGCVESVYLGDAVTSAISGFSSSEPDVELSIERHGFDALHNKLVGGSLDAAFTFSTQIGKLKGIICVDVEQRRRYAIMSKNHRLAALETVAPGDLRGETFVLHRRSDTMALCEDILLECGELGFYPEIRYAPTVDALLDYVEFAGCVAFLDKSITEIRFGRLRYCPTTVEKPFTLVCIYGKGNKNPALRRFIGHLQNHAPSASREQ